MSISRIGNGTSQACAACKYQRRKCAPDCILAPYFPHDRQRQFLNAHKLFGVSNITKIIKNLNPSDKDQAMRSIIFQSDARANDPVGGCYRIIRDLQRQIEFHKAELDLVLHQLALYRAAQAQAQAQSQHLQLIDSDSNCDNIGNSLDSLYDPVVQFGYPEMDRNQEEQEFVNVHQDYQRLGENVSVLTIQESNSCSSNSDPTSCCLQQQQHHHFVINNQQQCDDDFVNDCDDIKPLLDINDVKFEADELVERQFVPSTQLLISS